MSKDQGNDVYWNSLPIYPVAERLTPQRLGLLYVNTFLSATFAESFVYPLDVAKTRIQIEGEKAKKSGAKVGNAFRQISNIIQKEGALNLYSGLSAMVVRNILFNSTRLVVYDILRTEFISVDKTTNQEVLTVPVAFGCGFTAGCVGQAFANPFDIIKIRMQMEGLRLQMGHEPRVHGMIQSLKYIYKRGGLSGMWHGVGPSCLRACLMTAGDVGSYDLSKRNFKRYLHLNEGIPLRILSSMCAGLVASILSNPADVIKSRIMNQAIDDKGQGLQYKNSFDCVKQLFKQEGLLAFYKGLIPCWLRLGPWSILFWMSIEKLREWEGQTGF